MDSPWTPTTYASEVCFKGNKSCDKSCDCPADISFTSPQFGQLQLRAVFISTRASYVENGGVVPYLKACKPLSTDLATLGFISLPGQDLSRTPVFTYTLSTIVFFTPDNGSVVTTFNLSPGYVPECTVFWEWVNALPGMNIADLRTYKTTTQ